MSVALEGAPLRSRLGEAQMALALAFAAGLVWGVLLPLAVASGL